MVSLVEGTCNLDIFTCRWHPHVLNISITSLIYGFDLRYVWPVITEIHHFSHFWRSKGVSCTLAAYFSDISFDTNKACGPHSIPTNILQLIKPIIVDPLVEIINLTFTTGTYIENLKIARVIPIYKGKGSELLSSNYRPISLLSNINRIIEKLMHERLYSFLTKHNIIYELQFGFRKKHSTTHACSTRMPSILSRNVLIHDFD